jgi:hypothetical protein
MMTSIPIDHRVVYQNVNVMTPPNGTPSRRQRHTSKHAIYLSSASARSTGVSSDEPEQWRPAHCGRGAGAHCLPRGCLTKGGLCKTRLEGFIIHLKKIIIIGPWAALNGSPLFPTFRRSLPNRGNHSPGRSPSSQRHRARRFLTHWLAEAKGLPSASMTRTITSY